MSIQFDKYALLHTWQKHQVNKTRIEEEIQKGIVSIFTENKTNNTIMYNQNYFVVVLDQNNRLVTAFQSCKKYCLNKLNKNLALN